MRKTIDLLNEVVALGFNREDALEDIDASLDTELESRIARLEKEEETGELYEDAPMSEEEIPDELYNTILEGFKCEVEA